MCIYAKTKYVNMHTYWKNQNTSIICTTILLSFKYTSKIEYVNIQTPVFNKNRIHIDLQTLDQGI